MKLLALFVLVISILSLIDCKTSKNKHKKAKSVKGNGKRWITSSYMQGYMNSQPQQTPYGAQFAPDSAFSPTQENGPFADNAATSASLTAMAGLRESSYPNEDETRLSKQSFSNDNDDTPQSYAQEVVNYLKPGIGDYPSDMPMENMAFDSSPMSRGTTSNDNPVSTLSQTGFEDADLNPETLHKQKLRKAASKKKTDENEDAVNGDGKEVSLTPSDSSQHKPDEQKKVGHTKNAQANYENSHDETIKEQEQSTIEKTNQQNHENSEEKGETSSLALPKEKEKKVKEIGEDKKKKAQDIKDAFQPEKDVLKASKHKEQTGSRRQSYDNYIDTGLNHIEPVGLPAFKGTSPSEEFSDVDDHSNAVLQFEGDANEPSTVKQKLVTSLRTALMQNMNEVLSNDPGTYNNANDNVNPKQPKLDGEDEKKPKEAVKGDKADPEEDKKKMNKDEQDDANKEKQSSSGKEDENEKTKAMSLASKEKDDENTDKENFASSSEKTADEVSSSEYLEENLMKLDKKKLAHLLAGVMKSEGSKDSKDSYTGGDDEKLKASSQHMRPSHNQNYPSWSNSMKYKPHYSNFGLPGDPYAQIGLADPNNSPAPEQTGRHSVHHAKNDEDEPSDKNKEGNRKKVRKQNRKKLDENKEEGVNDDEKKKTGDVNVDDELKKNNKDEGENDENKARKQNRKEDGDGEDEDVKKLKNKENDDEKKKAGDSEGEEDQKKFNKEESEEKKASKQNEEDNPPGQNGEDKSKYKDDDGTDDEKKKISAESQDGKETKQDEASKLEEKVEKERQALKKLKDEEETEQKNEGNEENEPKASNKKVKDEDDSKNSDDTKKVNKNDDDEKAVSVKNGNFDHLASPELVNAIANNLKNKAKNGEEEDDNNEDGTSKGKESNMKQLLQHMKEKLFGSKSKNARRRQHEDDIYAQIGSADPNIKRRAKTERSEKKHHVRHHKH